MRRILRYHVSNKFLSPEIFAHHVMLFFFLFKDEKQLLSGCPPLYQNKLQEQGIQDVVVRKKIKFEPHGDLVDQAFSKFNEYSINNQDPYSQIENDETSEAEYPNENDSGDTETNKTSAIPNVMPQILPDDESINSLNSKQREVFNVVHRWAKNYVKYDAHDV